MPEIDRVARSRFLISVLLVGGCLFLLVSASADDQNNDGSSALSLSTKSDLIGVLQSAVALGIDLEPINLVAEYSASVEYPQGLVRVEQNRFRFVQSVADEYLVWAVERRVDDPSAGNKALGSLTINGAIVRGMDIARTVGANGVERHKAKDFNQALAVTIVPHPAYWGIFPFPTIPDMHPPNCPGEWLSGNAQANH